MSLHNKLIIDSFYLCEYGIKSKCDDNISFLWASTNMFLIYIMNLSIDSSEYIEYIEYIGDLTYIKTTFSSSNEVEFGQIISNFYSNILSSYPIIPDKIFNNKYLNSICNHLYNVYDIFEYYIEKGNIFIYGKCIRFSSIYKKLLNEDFEYHNNSIKIMIESIKSIKQI